MKIILTFILLATFSLAKESCEIDNPSDLDGYTLYEEALDEFNSNNYQDAYEKINESYEKDSSSRTKISVIYSCRHFNPDAYIPTVTSYTVTKVKDYQRRSLAKKIKKFLNPNPYIVIQQGQGKTIITVANVKKTIRGEVDSQFDLEEVQLSLSGSKTKNMNFGTIQSNDQKSQTISGSFSLEKLKIKMHEKFDIVLFNKD